MEKQLLIICATHGNERIGLEAVAILKKKKLDRYFDVVVGNPRALEENVRGTDCDLNRSYPGNAKAEQYEKRRAAEMLELARGYRFVIDLHEASSGTDNFIIIPRRRRGRVFPIGWLNLQTVLKWPDPPGPLGSVLSNTVELEFGVRDRPREEVVAAAVEVLVGFIARLDSAEGKRKMVLQQTYVVYGRLLKADYNGGWESLQDFQLTKFREESFFPLLVGQYLGEGILCYKMRKAGKAC